MRMLSIHSLNPAWAGWFIPVNTMATQKPRFGGASYRMDDFKHLHNTTMADKQQAQEGSISASISETETVNKNKASLESQRAKMKGPNGNAYRGSNFDTGKIDGIFPQQSIDLENTNVCYSVTLGVSDCHRTDEENLQHLMRVFKELGIKSQLRQYLRYPNKIAQVSSHAESQQETPLVSPFSGENRLSDEDGRVVYCKNLFLKDRRGQFYIVVCTEDCSVDLKVLKQHLNAHRNLSFADSESLRTVLQLKPGEVTPLAIMHKSAKDVRVAVLSKLAEMEEGVKFAFHPLCGDLQVELSYPELVDFMKYFGKAVEIVAEEILIQVKETHRKQEKEEHSAGAKPKHNLGRKSVTGKTNKQKSVVTKILPGAVESHGSFKSNPSDQTADPALNVSSDDLGTISSRRVETSVMAAQDGTTSSVLAEVHASTSANCNQLNINAPLKTNISQTHRNTLKNCLDRSECTVKGLGFTGENNAEQIITEETELNSERSSSKVGFSDGDSVQAISEVVDLQGKPRKRIFLSRKGKLRSYVKKDTQANVHADTGCDGGMQGRVEGHKDDRKGDAECEFDIEQTPETKLEIVEQFYSSLGESGVKYEEIDLSSEGGGTTIRPSVGCRCFLMKDKGGTFFFVVSHELYEPDFGRLKAALRPKKKLMAAQPADVITVLGTDPMKVSPFAVMTMNNPQPRVYITRKVLAPNLVFCIQHPYAQARRILMESAELQKYFRFLGVPFGSVEERHWNPRFNFPFSQFDTQQEGVNSGGCCGTHTQMPTGEDRDTSRSKLGSESKEDKGNGSLKSVLSEIFIGVHFSRFLVVLLHTLTQNTFPYLTYTSLSSSRRVMKNASVLQGSSVDAPVSSNSKSQITVLENGSLVEGHLSRQHKIQSISLLMSTEDLEKHLISLGVTFGLKKKQNRGISEDTYGNDKESNIIEHCAIMYLTNSAGHNFLIVGARDDFPMSVKRFCRRSRIREHLDIRMDPQGENECQFLSDFAPRMLPFALASNELRALISPTVEQTVCPGVTVALTTTLYIDPETIMEFTVGRERSRLRMTSSEFEKYCREVGFEVMYY